MSRVIDARLSIDLSKKEYMSLCVSKTTIWVPTRSDTNRAVQAQKLVRGLKFCLKVEEALNYPCSENKGADQLRGYREADLRLCFLLCRLLVFPCGGSYINMIRHTFLLGFLIFVMSNMSSNRNK